MREDENPLDAIFSRYQPPDPGEPDPGPAIAPDAAVPPEAAPAERSLGHEESAAASRSAREEVPPAQEAVSAAESPVDLNEITAELDDAAARLHRQAETLTAALGDAGDTSLRYSSDDGLVAVDLDGRPRIIGIHLDRHALRRGEELLGELVRVSINAALNEAEEGMRRRILDGLPSEMRSSIEEGLRPARAGLGDARQTAPSARNQELARREVLGRSDDELITVVAEGQGAIKEIRFATGSARRMGAEALCEGIAMAVNESLDRAEALWHVDEDADDLDRRLADIEERFNAHVDRTLQRLDELGGSLEGGTGERRTRG